MSKVKSSMDGKATSSSGGSSSASSSVDLKSSEKHKRDSSQSGTGTRTHSFLHCLGRRLGRHFPQEHQKQQQPNPRTQKQKQRCQAMLAVYNSEEDIHSSSTDSFSLSNEHCSTHTPSCPMTGSSIDLTGEERSSGASSAASAYSRYSSAVFASDADDMWSKHARRHFFVETIYRRPVSELGQHSTDEYSNNSQDDDEAQHDDGNVAMAGKAIKSTPNNNEAKHTQQQKTNVAKLLNANSISNSNSNSKRNNTNTPQSRSRSISPCSITKGLHLSRISITSSVCRMFQHLTTSSSPTTSTRSHSCSSTPLRCSIQNNTTKTSVTTQPKNGSSKKATAATAASASSVSNSKKKEKKQQSILRPPVHYVYMKGMSGLYSRVPRYTVCCPYRTT